MGRQIKGLTAKWEAHRFVRAMKALTACKGCGRHSRKRVGERTPRRPLDWYPLNRDSRRLTGMVLRGASIEEIKEEMGRCIPLCSSCARRWADGGGSDE